MTLRSTLLLLTTAFAGLWTGAAQAQFRCGIDAARRALIARDPHLLEREAAAEAAMRQAMSSRDDVDDTTVFVIPVVFHILHELGSENISDAQIHDAMTVLNRDYSLQNADVNDACCGFRNIASDIRLEFRLAQLDPYGYCTDGIDRIMTFRNNNADDGSKLNPWFRERYLNVWVVNSIANGAAGYSYYPSSVEGSLAIADGVLLLNDYVGRIGTSNEGRSRALTHEVGHWLNLQHTWGDTNGEDGAPAGHMVAECGDDLVEDTPWTRGHDLVCPLLDYDCSTTAFNQQYRCDSVTTSTGIADPTVPPNAVVEVNDTTDRVVTTFSHLIAAGVSENPVSSGRFEFTGWGTGAPNGATSVSQLTGAIDLNKYYEFSIAAPVIGAAMTVDSIEFKVQRNLTGARSFSVRSSLDNFANNIPRGSLPNGVTSASGNTLFYSVDTNLVRNNTRVKMTANPAYNHMTSAVTFRIYAWNAEDEAGSFGIDDLRLYGNFGVIENVQNYMEYSYCSVMFTEGQKDRMRTAVNSDIASRKHLWSEGNRLLTGTEDGHVSNCAPRADFFSYVVAPDNSHNFPFTCPGVPVHFQDNSEVADPTAWQWEFPGGDPSTSTLQNPTVTYPPEGGTFSATLTVSNEYGSSSVQKDNVAYISPNYGDIVGLLTQPFNSVETSPHWISFNPEQNRTLWQWNGQTGHFANGCYRMNGSATVDPAELIGNAVGDLDELVTPTMDLRFLSGGTFSFWFAASTMAATSQDVTEKLIVYSSNDCGESWQSRLSLNTPQLLITGGSHGAGYIPEAGDWRQASFSIPLSLQREHVRFKFSYTAGQFSNDLFLDDVNIDGTVGVDELAAQSGFLGLIPNPASDEVTVDMDLAGSTTGTLSFVDPTGRVVYSRGVGAAQQRLVLDLRSIGLSSGVYLVRLDHAKGKRVQRLVVR